MTTNAFDGSGETGSPIQGGVPNPNELASGGIGETPKVDTVPKDGETPKEGDVSQKVDLVQHKELESLVGKQGTELGEYRKFFSDIAPLLDKLDKSPELVQAIVDGKLTTELAQAAIEGKVSVDDAKIVDKAHEAVKKDLGKEGYKGATPDEVTKLVEDKAEEIKSGLQKELKARDEYNAFEAGVSDFVSRTPDFAEYASDINKWLDKHDVTDIAVAYYAVKGELSEKDAEKKAKVDEAEAKKNMALNAGGGSSIATHIKGDNKLIDTLISSKSDPNTF